MKQKTLMTRSIESKEDNTQSEFEKEERHRSRASDDYDSNATIDVQLESSDVSYTDIHVCIYLPSN